jgi:hypothetical protein
MNSNDIAIIAACILLALALLVFVFQVDPDESDSMPHRSRLDQLLERRDAVYENLRDLRFEYRAGKFSEKDYEEMKQALEVEAAQILAEMDRVTGGTPTPATRQAAGMGKARS